MSKHQITCKSLQKSSKCQEFPKGLALFLGRASQKNHPVYLFLINVSQLQMMVMSTVPATASPSKRRSTSCSEVSELYILHLVFDICYILFMYIV